MSYDNDIKLECIAADTEKDNAGMAESATKETGGFNSNINDGMVSGTTTQEGKESLTKRNELTMDAKTNKYLIYGVTDSPPIHITAICALQQGLLSLPGQLIVSLLVAEAVCASNNNLLKARLLSSTLFMNGITTVCMNLLGIRLPLFQGAAPSYIIPLLLVTNVDGPFCSSKTSDAEGGTDPSASTTTMSSVNLTVGSFNASAETDSDEVMDRIFNNIRMMQGSLMIAGFVHAFVGFTGLIGILLRFVGPLTIVPTLVLLFIFLVEPVLKFVEVSWPIASSTITIAVILFLYLSKYNMPVPVWTPSIGFRVISYPLHQVFALLISILINWGICGILTVTGVLTDDKNNIQFNARIDARSEIIYDNPWFTFPYPGQYGAFSYNSAALLSFMVATLVSILDSIGDYYACARVCRVPAPPKHAVNRGLFIEGMCTMLSGAVGCGHATSTYGGNIGAIGVTKVGSRHVFIATGLLSILFGIFGKFSAIFITIPYPVLGGAFVVMIGIFFGVVVSNLEVTNMSSPRNIAIIGLSIFIGLSVPTWVKRVKTPVETGNDAMDKIISMLLGNPNLVGTIIACFLDNTVPGTDEERGIAAWRVSNEDELTAVDNDVYDEVYNPLLPKRLLYSKLMKYIPFLPYKRKYVERESANIKSA